jgi:hypothetical protein
VLGKGARKSRKGGGRIETCVFGHDRGLLDINTVKSKKALLPLDPPPNASYATLPILSRSHPRSITKTYPDRMSHTPNAARACSHIAVSIPVLYVSKSPLYRYLSPITSTSNSVTSNRMMAQRLHSPPANSTRCCPRVAHFPRSNLPQVPTFYSLMGHWGFEFAGVSLLGPNLTPVEESPLGAKPSSQIVWEIQKPSMCVSDRKLDHGMECSPWSQGIN